jgi:hypothetical protein
VWRTPKNMIVSIPGAPEQGFASAREMVSLKCMVSVSVAKAAAGASGAADSVRPGSQPAAVVVSAWTS